jgi:hypothetical protein
MALGAAPSAHGNNDHVRGVVTELSATSVTVQVSGQGSKTLSLTPKTTFEKSGKPAHFADLKVGDRVIIDVPKGTTEAHEIRFGAAPKKVE